MIGTDWSTPGLDLPPLSPRTGVFPTRCYLETWWRHRAAPDDRLLLVEHAKGLLPAMIGGDGVVVFVGERDLTDYHSPLGSEMPPLVAELATAAPGAVFRFDSLPASAAEPLAEALTEVGATVTTTRTEVAAVLGLPASFDDYLELIGKKERHETRRKRRRFAAALGEPRLRRAAGAGAVAEFAVMHATASGDKGEFFTRPILDFFTALEADTGGFIDVLTGDDDVPVAAAFGFEDDDTYYLYNSAYDPSVGDVSPGVVLVSMLIEQSITHGKSGFDFLKGDETYKFRLGATERPLYEVTGRLGDT